MVRRIVAIGCAWLVLTSMCAAQVAKKIDVRKLTVDELRTLESRAKRGEERSMTILGMAYAEGKGSVESAVKWLTKAARHDDVAQSYLAGMYREGHTVPQDLAQARSLYGRAA